MPSPDPQRLDSSAALRRSASRRPRLLVVTSLYPNAARPNVGAFVAGRVAALRAAGIDVAVIAPTNYEIPLERRLPVLAVRALTRRGRFAGVEGHVLYPAGLIALAAARLRRRPVVLYAHGADVLEVPQLGRLHGTLMRFAARSADAVVTNSRSMAEAIAGFGVEASVIPPGVDFERFRPLDRDAARAELGLAAGERIALYLGAFIERKGIDVFSAALAQAPGWRGIAVGDGELAERIAAERSVRLVPTVAPEDVPQWLSAADVVVVPSRREPLGMAAVEALACGVPVVASDVGGLRETVRDGVNGLLVPPADPSALAAALVRLSDDGLRGRLAGAARESVRGHESGHVRRAMAEVWARLGVRLEPTDESPPAAGASGAAS